MSNTTMLRRGGQAEHCPKCKINVMPTVTARGNLTRLWCWVCPYCRTATVPHV